MQFGGNPTFQGTYRFHLQGGKVRQARNQQKQVTSWRWRWYIPPKRLVASELHGVTAQKKASTTVSDVRTPDPALSHVYVADTWNLLLLRFRISFLFTFFLRLKTQHRTLFLCGFRPCGLFRFRTNSETMTCFRHVVGHLGWGIGVFEDHYPHR
jgi:hypothetical protein